jgi:hypothetical protein
VGVAVDQVIAGGDEQEAEDLQTHRGQHQPFQAGEQEEQGSFHGFSLPAKCKEGLARMLQACKQEPFPWGITPNRRQAQTRQA